MAWKPRGMLGLSEALSRVDVDVETAKARLRDGLAEPDLAAYIVNEGDGEHIPVPLDIWRTHLADTAFRMGRVQFPTGERFWEAAGGEVFLYEDDLEGWLSGDEKVVQNELLSGGLVTSPAGQEMLATLEKLLAGGSGFQTTKEAHSAVLKELGQRNPKRGYSYQSFAKIASDRLRSS